MRLAKNIKTIKEGIREDDIKVGKQISSIFNSQRYSTLILQAVISSFYLFGLALRLEKKVIKLVRLQGFHIFNISDRANKLQNFFSIND